MTLHPVSRKFTLYADYDLKIEQGGPKAACELALELDAAIRMFAADRGLSFSYRRTMVQAGINGKVHFDDEFDELKEEHEEEGMGTVGTWTP